MSDLKISRKHNLDHDECCTVAEDLLGKLVDKFGGQVSQQGDSYLYRHTTGMKATVQPKQGELDIVVKLNLMTRSFAPQIKSQVNQVLDKYIPA